ncbi:MAG TPA: rhodanese-like domain-containing protein [Pseudolabrys sp.]|nr:rhodanese-like domain-containing protein [Pseudolabrys sp.]
MRLAYFTGLLGATLAFSLAHVGLISAAQGISIEQATLMEPEAKTGEVSTEELRRILADGSAIVIDARPRAEFDAGHIPGARVLDTPPDDQIGAVERLVKGDKAAALVVYCNGPYCQASRRLAERLMAAGFTNVRRYQLGMPVWRALGGPTVIELNGILRIFKADQTAVFIDARPAEDFAKGSLPGARNLTVQTLDGTLKKMMSGKLTDPPLPLDDFNRRIVLFGQNGAQVLGLAKAMSKRPWYNVAYFPGSYEAIAAALHQ